MKHWLQFLAVLVMVLIAGISPQQASAAPSVGSSGTANTTRIINDIIRRTPGITTRTTTGTGVTVKATGTSSIAAGRGITIPISEAAEAAVSGGRIAGIAARAIRWGSWVGVASVVIPWVAEQSGIVTCPPPDFFCKERPPQEVDPSTGGYGAYSIHTKTNVYASSGEQVCSKLFELMPIGSRESIFWKKNANNAAGECLYTARPFGSPYAVVGTAPATCPAGTKLTSNGIGCIEEKPGLAPVPEPELAGAIEKAMEGKPDRQGAAYDAISNAGFPIFNMADPVTVTTPPAVTGPQVTSTSTVPKPDGSVDTVNVTMIGETKPKVTGTTIGDMMIAYPTTVTTTTTTTNNVTGKSTVTTLITNNYPQPSAPPIAAPPAKPVELPTSPNDKEANSNPTKIPDDYNREVTQKSILGKLEEFMKPITTTLPDGNAEVESIQAKNEEGLGVVTGITPETVNVKNWFPSVPTTACVNPQVPVPLGSGTVTFPICGYVNTFSNLISGVIAFFCILGCVHQVQSALKA